MDDCCNVMWIEKLDYDDANKTCKCLYCCTRQTFFISKPIKILN